VSSFILATERIEADCFLGVLWPFDSLQSSVVSSVQDWA
jgi:hypothetical protein